jgi:hypothetical protein
MLEKISSFSMEFESKNKKLEFNLSKRKKDKNNDKLDCTTNSNFK